MNGKHYVRSLMLERLSGDARDLEIEGGRVRTAGETRRFRRMAEHRKRQILERMLLDSDIESE